MTHIKPGQRVRINKGTDKGKHGTVYAVQWPVVFVIADGDDIDVSYNHKALTIVNR